MSRTTREASPSPRDLDVLRAVRDLMVTSHRPPVLREIGDRVGLRSSSTVWAHVHRLRLCGLLTVRPKCPAGTFLTPAALRLLGNNGFCPQCGRPLA